MANTEIRRAIELPPEIPKLPANIASLKGIKWGRRRYADDIVLDRPVLIAFRHSNWQALYKTIENPRLGMVWGDRAFLLDNDQSWRRLRGIDLEMRILAHIKMVASILAVDISSGV